MLQELTAGVPSRTNLANRLLTPLVRKIAEYLLRWEPDGTVIVEFPTGHRVQFGRMKGDEAAFIKLSNYGVLWKSLRRGPIGFAEAFIDGDFEADNLDSLFHFFLCNRDRLCGAGGSLFRVRVGDRFAHLLRRNSRKGSRRNISDHYDLGNEFYRLWLDDEMNYSSGIYTSGARSLEMAQDAKINAALEMLELRGGEDILEIGSGWGAFARAAARKHEAKVTGLTLSHEQLALASERASDEALDGNCIFRLQDYRDTKNSYDRIVSIEMIEAVGEENWPQYFKTLHDRLEPDGSAVIQSITICSCVFPRYRRKADFIQRYIFPGGMLPTQEIIGEQAERAGLKLETKRTFGRCYARTLDEWRDRFEAAWPQIADLGFDERFRRKWLYYLAYCKAGFEDGVIDVGLYRLRRR